MLKYLSVVFKGMCMGAADVIPGVSGGTIAFLMGIYKELIDSIKSVNIEAAKILFSGNIKEFWKHINGTFLVSVFLGVLISVFSLARLMKYLLEFHPIPLWSFFFGLILASAIYILRELDKWSLKNIFCLAIGVVIAAYICLASPSTTPESYWFLFLSGAIAVCAMILPGISGSFILLLLGKYEFIMHAVTTLNIPVLIVVAAGAVIGLLSFSHLLSWLLKRYYMQTISLLSGFMIGSLLKVWPWKKEIVLNSITSGVEELPTIDYPTLPSKFAEITGQPALLGEAIIFMVIGLGVVLAIELIAGKKSEAK